MFPFSRKPAHSPHGRRFGFVASMVLALITAASLTACGGDSEDAGGPAPDASPTTEATPSAGDDPIAFEQVIPGAEEERDLYAVGRDGGQPRLLRSRGNYPHWSPDGSQLAFLACLNPPDCTTAVALMERSTGDVHGFSMPDPDLFTPCAVWTPAGTELACAGLSDTDPTRNGVYTIRATDGKGLTRITKNPGGEDSPLAYSPDGSQLLLNRGDPSRADSANQALFIAPVGGGQPHRITPWGYADDAAGWSPDGRTIVFGTNGSLYRVSPDGQGLAEINVEMPDGSSAETAFDVDLRRRDIVSPRQPGAWHLPGPPGRNRRRAVPAANTITRTGVPRRAPNGPHHRKVCVPRRRAPSPTGHRAGDPHIGMSAAQRRPDGFGVVIMPPGWRSCEGVRTRPGSGSRARSVVGRGCRRLRSTRTSRWPVRPGSSSSGGRGARSASSPRTTP